MFDWIKTYLIGILVTLLIVSITANGMLWYMNDSKQEEINKLNVNIGVTAALSQQQVVKIVESNKIVKDIQWKTNDRIKIVKEYIYDANKTDCANAIDAMRNTF